MKKIVDSKSSFFTGTTFLIAILGILYSCNKSTNDMTTTTTTPGTKGTGPGANEVYIQDMAFNPVTISVTIGVKTTITWTNKDAISHTVTSDTGLFDSGPIASNGTFTYMFTAAGSYKYHCSIHPTMTAEVVVLPAPTSGY